MLQWKKQAVESLPDVFSDRRARAVAEDEGAILPADWATQSRTRLGQKKLASRLEEKRRLIEPPHADIGVQQQCELLGLARASYYYEPRGERAENLRLLNLLADQYTATSSYDMRNLTDLGEVAQSAIPSG